MSQNTTKLSTVRFSADEDERLIEFVQNNALLYDLKHPEFKNTMKKDLIWNEAGKILKKEGEFLLNTSILLYEKCYRAILINKSIFV